MISIMKMPPPLDRLPPEAAFPVALEKGAAAFRQGATALGPFFVVSGRVELVRHGEAGEAIVVHRAGPGETLAEASLFSESYHCDCVAVAPARLIGLRKAPLMALFESDGAFAAALLRRMAGQVQAYRRRIEIMSIRSAEERVRAALAEFGIGGAVNSFAAEIGLTPEATYRALAALTRKGVVRREGRGRYRLAAAPPRG